MVTGVQEVPKTAHKILFYTDTNGKQPNVAYELVQTGKSCYCQLWKQWCCCIWY